MGGGVSGPTIITEKSHPIPSREKKRCVTAFMSKEGERKKEEIFYKKKKERCGQAKIP